MKAEEYARRMEHALLFFLNRLVFYSCVATDAKNLLNKNLQNYHDRRPELEHAVVQQVQFDKFIVACIFIHNHNYF